MADSQGSPIKNAGGLLSMPLHLEQWSVGCAPGTRPAAGTVARKAGQTLATKKGATTPMAQSLLPQLEGMGSGGMPFQALLTEPALAGPPREVVLTPRAERVRRRHLDEDDDLG